MNAIRVYENASHKLNMGEITIGEWDELVGVLNDVEPVVRCKDCRYRCYSISNLWCDIFDKIMPENGYCSFGERRN